MLRSAAPGHGGQIHLGISQKAGDALQPFHLPDAVSEGGEGGRGGSGADASQLPPYLCFSNADAGRGPGDHPEHRGTYRCGHDKALSTRSGAGEIGGN